MPPVYLSRPEHHAALLTKYDTFLFDLDGVVWMGPAGETLTPSIIPTLAHLRALGKRLAFITNNATHSRAQYLAKFHRLGLTDVVIDEIFSCGSASASFLREVVLPGIQDEGKRGVYVIGQASLEEELRLEGITWKGGTDPEDDVLLPYQDFSSITPDPTIGVVLFSFQTRINYKQLAKGFNYIATNPGCQLILTNDDHAMPFHGGMLPGEGAIASVLLGARKNLIPTIVGKPHQPLLDVVQRTLKFDPATTIMVGDRLETDVLFGKRGGVSTLLVWTGSSKPHDLVGLPDHHEPTYIANCVGELLTGVTVPVAA